MDLFDNVKNPRSQFPNSLKYKPKQDDYYLEETDSPPLQPIVHNHLCLTLLEEEQIQLVESQRYHHQEKKASQSYLQHERDV